MDKLINYIKNGKGIGALFLMASAVLMTLIMAFMIKDIYAELRPQATLISEDILPLTIKNHKIINKTQIYKQYGLTLGDDNDKTSFPVIFDTRNDTSEMPKGKNGIYIMTDAIYMATPSETRRFEFQKDGVIDKASFESLVNYVTNSIYIVVSTILIVIYFFVGLLKATLSALIATFGQRFILGEKLFDIKTLMRLSSIATACIELLSFTLLKGMSFVQFILLVLLIELIFLHKEKTTQN